MTKIRDMINAGIFLAYFDKKRYSIKIVEALFRATLPQKAVLFKEQLFFMLTGKPRF